MKQHVYQLTVQTGNQRKSCTCNNLVDEPRGRNASSPRQVPAQHTDVRIRRRCTYASSYVQLAALAQNGRMKRINEVSKADFVAIFAN